MQQLNKKRSIMYYVELYVKENDKWHLDYSRLVSDIDKRMFIKKIKQLGFSFCPLRGCYVCEGEVMEFHVVFHKQHLRYEK